MNVWSSIAQSRAYCRRTAIVLSVARISSSQTLDDNGGGAAATVADAGAPDCPVILLEHLVQGADDASTRRPTPMMFGDGDRKKSSRMAIHIRAWMKKGKGATSDATHNGMINPARGQPT